ncbi:hypothetical protein [Stigmatella erecta]|uniref:Uncharacterized protein n=1 Tax=Stigmatella erecta TaxID=83460 RepID=A0A1I0KZ57_9BACT|nr:hypothetical protein [Stigmatella erecta]SEU32001.1 hypothetical protein SAMN05443639_116134 [Stigmatella erecta]
MPSVAQQVEAKLSCHRPEALVPALEQREVVQLLRRDSHLSATLGELSRHGTLEALVRRVEAPEPRRTLLEVLAAHADAAQARAVQAALARIDLLIKEGAGPTVAEELWQVRFNLLRLGVPAHGQRFDDTPYQRVIPRDGREPFTGQGATGIRPDARTVPRSDKWSRWRQVPPPAPLSAAPTGDWSTYLAKLGAKDRLLQAKLVLRRPLTTLMPTVWGPLPPSRAELIAVAARQYGQEPALLAALLLAEQRDQSAQEEARHYALAAEGEGASFLGLGQVALPAVTHHALLSEVLAPEVLRHASPPHLARLLADDALNIMASAKYLRVVALAHPPPPPPEPGDEAQDGPPPENPLHALAARYTGRAREPARAAAWGHFVHEAYCDVKAARVFP